MIRKKIACLMLAGGMLMSLVTPSTIANAATTDAPLGYFSVGDLIQNNTFDDGVGLPWNQVETSPADGDFNIDGGSYNVTINKKIEKDEDAVKTADRWPVQLRHRGLTLEKGHTYTVKFKVKSTADCHVYAQVAKSGGDYYQYWNLNHRSWKPMAVGTSWTPVSETFTMDQDTQNGCEMTFHLVGDDCVAATLPYTVSFDDIHVYDTAFPGYPIQPAEPQNAIRVNQVGYYKNIEKTATVVTAATSPISWSLLNKSGDVVKTGTTTVFGKDTASGEYVHQIDFSDFNTEGTGYKLQIDSANTVAKVIDKGSKESPGKMPNVSLPFEIGTKLYDKMKSDSIKYFYHNRSGIPIAMPYAGSKELTRAAGHKSDVMENATTKDDLWYLNEKGSETTVDVSGGWYDAGDHGKYVVNGGISTWTMMNQYERALYNQQKALTGAPFADNTMNIPESGNSVPDILDETRYNLECLLKFQIADGVNEYAGMAHHKAHDDSWTALGIAPANDPMKRHIKPPSTAATLNLAAVAAQGSRLYEKYDSTFAAKCLTAAEKAWAAAVEHPAIYAPMLGATGGGAYGDDNVTDEFYWAACELYATTGKSTYLDYIKNSSHYLEMPTTLNGGEDKGLTGSFDWGNVQGMGTITLALVNNGKVDPTIQTTARTNILAAADGFIENEKKEGYGTPETVGPMVSSYGGVATKLTGYPWGSNCSVANEAIVMAYANDFKSNASDRKYINGTAKAMDYLLGENANVQSYVTGYGTNPLENPHHRFWSYQADNKFPHAPAGCMSGGPNSGVEDPWVQGSGWKKGSRPAAKCFMDNIESWATNEVTINWNSPFAWVSSYMADNADPAPIVLGDINNDGVVDILDYIELQNLLLSGDPITNPVADLNADGRINTSDLLALRKNIVNE